jgi:hypothetical protein
MTEATSQDTQRRTLIGARAPYVAVVAGCLIGLLTGGNGAPVHANPNGVVAADHWTYAALYRLAALGLAPLWAASARPLPRLEVARMVAAALDRATARPSRDAPVSEAARADLEALRQEFADELRVLDAMRAGLSQSSRVALSAGGSARVVSGVAPRFTRYQSGGIEMSRLYLGTRVGDIGIQVGRDSVWWGPGSRGAFLLSDNTGPFDYLSLTLTSGRFRAVKLIAPLRDPGRYLYGLRLDWQARDDLRLGLGEVMVGAGGLSWLYALNPLPGAAYGIAERVRKPAFDDNYNLAVDFDWCVRPGVVLYGELYMDDVILFDPYNPFPNRLGGTVGLYLAAPFGDRRTDVRLEHSRASNWVYASFQSQAQYVRAGRALGHWCAPDCELWSLTVTRRLSPTSAVLVGYDLIRKGEGRLGETWTGPDDAWQHLYLSGVTETMHALRVTASRRVGDAHTALTIVWSTASNADHVVGATREGWFILWEGTYGF